MFKKVYRIVLLSWDNKTRHISFFRGSVWGAVSGGVELAKEKSKKEKDDFACFEVKRIK